MGTVAGKGSLVLHSVTKSKRWIAMTPNAGGEELHMDLITSNVIIITTTALWLKMGCHFAPQQIQQATMQMVHSVPVTSQPVAGTM